MKRSKLRGAIYRLVNERQFNGKNNFAMQQLLSSVFKSSLRLSLTSLFAVFLISTSLPVNAQQVAQGKPGQAVSVEDLKDLAAVMKDEAAREKLLSRIQALIATKEKAEAKPPLKTASARLISILSQSVKEASRQLVVAADALGNTPALVASLMDKAADSKIRQRWIDLIAKVALILIAGAIMERLVRFLLRRPRRALEERETDSLLVRLPLLAGRTALDLVPLAAFATAAYVAVPLAHASDQGQVIALTLMNAYLIVCGLLALARMVLAPAVTTLRVLPLNDITANYLFIWTRRLVGLSVFGFFFAEVSLVLGLPAGGYRGLLHVLGMLITSLTVVFLLQNRAPVATWIRGGERTRRAGHVLTRFADIWHVLAVLYTVAFFGVWVLGIEGGFEYLARATAISAIILIVARLFIKGLERVLDKSFAIRPEIRDRFPTLKERANRYLPAMRQLLRWTVGLLTAFAILETWGVNALGWLETPLGERFAQSAFSIVAVIILALVLWEVVNNGVEHYLGKTDTEGNVVQRSARTRTLLPLLRKAIFIVLAVLVSLIVLAEIGIEIGPLLAGAGVLGLAFGFGAQTLVKDIITGLFILIEDTIAVGDYVGVSGHEGTVESLSIRTIRLRDPAGSVHTVPFSDVGTVLNYTKDYSIVVLNIGIAYRENVDEVMKVIEDIGQEMAEDQMLARDILAPLEVQGLQSLDDSAVVIRARIKVKAGSQWGMKREFNHRMKNRFDELGIEIPFPQQAITFGEDREGNAVAGRITVEDKRQKKASTDKPAPKRKARIVQDKGDASDGMSGDGSE